MLPLTAACLLCACLAAGWWHERDARRRALAAAAAEAAATHRAAHLAALDLRGAALRLHGLAPLAAPLTALAERCRLLAEDLAAIGGPRHPVLRREPLDLSACTRDAVAALSAALAPGRRRFELDLPPRADLPLDRRALREILRRVLGEAALDTAEQDVIRVRLEPAPQGGWLLAVADEGSGLADPAEGAPAHTDSRGIGASLALARDLMAAHGGTLDVQAARAAGTLVALWFPPAPPLAATPPDAPRLSSS